MFRDPDFLKKVIIVIIIISVGLTGLSQLLSWGDIDVDAKIGGGRFSREASLDAEFNEYSVDYSVIIKTGGEITNKTEEYKIFLTGMGDFQVTVGELLDSYKNKNYTIKALIWNNLTKRNDYTNVTVKTQVDFVPWWPVNMPQKASVTIKIESTNDLIQKVQINKVWLQLYTGWDDEKDDFTKSKTIWEKSSKSELSKKGDSKTYETEITIDDDHGKIGLVGYADITVIDVNGAEVGKVLIPFISTSHPATLNIYTMTQGEFYSVILMVLAFPLTILSIILSVIAIPLAFKRHRFSVGILLAASILSILAIIFYINGINTLVDLIDAELETDVKSGFSLNFFVLSLPIISIVLLFIAFVFAFINRIPKAKAKEMRRLRKESKGAEPTEPPITFRVLGEDEKKAAEDMEPERKLKPKKRKGKKRKKR